MIGFALSLACVGLSPPVLGLLIAAASSFGLFLAGMTGTLYAVIAGAFPSSMRASGVGLVMGVGRIASALGPALAGWLFSYGMDRASVSLLFAAAPVLAALLISTFKPRNETEGTVRVAAP
jgi:MFS family permease